MTSKALFITYDGLLDPLGASQILPYVEAIARHPRPVVIISFEKPERLEGADRMRARLKEQGIDWAPLPFTRGGKIGKAWDLCRMYLTALRLTISERIGIVHCRSYQAAQVGCFLKRLTCVRVIFDMRGFWPDERIDGGIWNLSRLVDRTAYKFYKWTERRLLECADSVVSLTDRALPELRRIAPNMRAPVTVIPCCADYDHFKPIPESRRAKLRAELGFSEDNIVVCYLGSLGTWYMFSEMLSFFAKAAETRDHLRWLIVTKDWREENEAQVEAYGSKSLRDKIVIREAAREEVPDLLGSSDLLISFIKPAYSKIASSPTKLAEAFAMGVPTLSNAMVGDVERLIEELDAGLCIDVASSQSADAASAEIEAICSKGGPGLRERSRGHLCLSIAQQRYQDIYSGLEGA